MNPLRFVMLPLLVALTVILPGCAGKAASGFRNPAMTAKFESIPKDEQRPLRDGMNKTGARELEDFEYQYLFAPKDSYSPEELAAAIKNWHEQISAISNARGTRIAAHDRIEIHLVYVSSKADSGSGATVFIEPFPAGARLFLDTPLPNMTSKMQADGSVQLNRSGKFETSLPFSFIRSTNRIYFHTAYRGSVRYFYYDIDGQRQEEVPAQSPEEWDHYRRNGTLPSR